MAIQLSVEQRNARLNAIETTLGTAPLLQIFTGGPPANTNTANSGTLLCNMTLPSDWANDAANGAKAKNGTWQANASNNGTAGHFRLFISNAARCDVQGTAGSGANDLVLDNAVIATNQVITITAFTLTDGNP